MPELPEVEVTRRRIAPLLLGRRIRRVHTTRPSYFYLTEPDVLRRRLRGRSFDGLERRGKYLVGAFGDGSRLLLHLGMTGQLFSEGVSSVRLLRSTARGSQTSRCFEPDEHTHLQLEFEDAGPRVLFRDVRKFGKVRWLEPGEPEARLDKLGVDALAATGEHLFRVSRKRDVAVKNLLLDQRALAGVGNIYADEALFHARIRPTRRARRVRRLEYEVLATELRRVLERSIETGGSSISDYVAPDGADGAYQDERAVYARTGEPCPSCGSPVRRIVLGQRGTHFCRICQR